MTPPPDPVAARTIGGMEWPARCLDCGLVTEDPDAYVITSADEDGEYVPDHACPRTEREHRWARAAIEGRP